MLDRIPARQPQVCSATGLGHAARSTRARPQLLGVWRHLGISAGAHSNQLATIVRQVRVRDPSAMARLARALAQDRRAPRRFAVCYLLNALRLREGFALPGFTERTGLSVNAVGAGAGAAPGLIEREGNLVRHRARF